MVPEPGQESALDGPTSQQLRIDDLAHVFGTKSSNIAAGYWLPWQPYRQHQRNIDLHKFPVGRAVPSPQRSMTMDADETTPGDDEIAAVTSKTVQTNVCCLAKIVVEQTADFCERFFPDTFHRLCVARLFVIRNHQVHGEREEWTGILMDTCFHRRCSHILPYEVQTPVKQILKVDNYAYLQFKK